jgi:AcrR family transcriptional regulator
VPGLKEQTPPTAAPRRRGTLAATRQKLLDATISIVRREGVAALTTVRIMQLAGFAQSAFYLHFRSVPECLRAAAEQVAERIRRFVAEHRQAASASTDGGLAAVVGHYDAVLALFEQERAFAELFLRYRRDVSPLGKVMRQLHQELRADLEADLLRSADLAGLPPAAHDRVRMQADFVLANVLAAGEAMLDRRCTDRAQLADELTQTALATVLNMISRYRP